jgi:hypothetical protein
MKELRFLFHPFIAAVTLFLCTVGCANTKQTEQMLSDAGFKRVAATTTNQLQQLKAMPADKLTVAKLNGKKYYVFPDPARKIIFVGNLEQYQTYQEILSLRKIEGQNRVDADLGDEGSTNDTVTWAEWTDNSGWTFGSY